MTDENQKDADEKSSTEHEPENESRLYKKLTPFRSAAVFVNIPITLLACTIVGYLIGDFIEKRIPAGGAFVAVFSMLGVAAGFREILMLVKKRNK